MPQGDIRIRSSEGSEFDAYFATPDAGCPAPAVVLACAIHGVDDDIRAMAAEFAARGYVAAAPDLFWRTLPGPLARGDARAAQRAQPRLERIAAGERDLADVLRALREQPLFNGRAALMGFCYSGPYAILGPRRLGYHAGIACHGTRMLDFIDELDAIDRPVRILWGDRDTTAPASVLEAYRRLAARERNVDVHVLPGVRHGYMMRGNVAAFDRAAYRFSMECALAALESLRASFDNG